MDDEELEALYSGYIDLHELTPRQKKALLEELDKIVPSEKEFKIWFTIWLILSVTLGLLAMLAALAGNLLIFLISIGIVAYSIYKAKKLSTFRRLRSLKTMLESDSRLGPPGN